MYTQEMDFWFQVQLIEKLLGKAVRNNDKDGTPGKNNAKYLCIKQYSFLRFCPKVQL